MSISLAPQLANYHSWLIAFSEIKSKVGHIDGAKRHPSCRGRKAVKQRTPILPMLSWKPQKTTLIVGR